MSHSFTYETGWKIIDENGNVRATNEDKQRVETNGTVEVEVLDSDKETVLQNCKQPFKSFVKGFLMDLVLGYRVSARNVSFGADPKVFCGGRIATSGSAYGDSPAASERYETNTYIDAVGFIQKLSPTVNSPSQVYLNSVQKNANSISIKLSSIQQITSGTGTIREVGLFSDNTNDYNSTPQFNTLIAKDILTTPLTYNPNQYVRVKYNIEIPFSNQKVITQNWIYNWLQNLTAPFSGIFKDIEGNPYVGINEITSQTFTKATNIQGLADDDTMGIVVGTDGGTLYPVDWDNYRLGNQISHGTSDNQLVYNVTNIPSSEPAVAYTEGTARVTFFRNFTNSSNSDITVKEAGVIAKTSDAANEGVSSNGSYLIVRWLTEDVVVKPNETLVVYWQPSIQADSTTAYGKSLNLNNVIVLTNDLRKQHPGLRNITMIQKNPQTSINWGNAKAYAANLKNVDGYGGFTCWRLPIQTDTGTTDVESHELRVLYDNKNNILSGWNPFIANSVTWADNQYSTNNGYCMLANGNISNYETKNSSYNCLCVR